MEDKENTKCENYFRLNKPICCDIPAYKYQTLEKRILKDQDFALTL